MEARWEGRERRSGEPPDEVYRRRMRQQGEWNEVTAMAVQRDNDEERQQRVDAILQQLRREDVSPERTRKAQLPSSRTDGHRTKKPVQE